MVVIRDNTRQHACVSYEQMQHVTMLSSIPFTFMLNAYVKHAGRFCETQAGLACLRNQGDAEQGMMHRSSAPVCDGTSQPCRTDKRIAFKAKCVDRACECNRALLPNRQNKKHLTGSSLIRQLTSIQDCNASTDGLEECVVEELAGVEVRL